MPVKILLADKSITIQKVVEMLFSGKEYEVLCVSDGETALTEAGRVVPDVVLADIDLPRVDGYAFSGKLRQIPALAQTPVILMLSRDDVFDQAKAKQAAIVDHIAKPFESQELIGKVKKAVGGGAARSADAPVAAAVAPKPAAPPLAPKPQPAKKAAAPDIFDIIEDAPSHEDVQRSSGKADEESFYEVEPVVEVEEELPRETAKALPVGEKAVAEMREGLGLGRPGPSDDDIVSFESLNEATSAGQEYAPPQKREPAPEAREWKPPVQQPAARTAPRSAPASQQAALSESDIWSMAESTVAKVAREMLGNMPPPALPEQELRSMVRQIIAEQGGSPAKAAMTPNVSEDMVQRAVTESVQGVVQEMAREIIEKVAWEVVPDLAAAMIREEIERLKALQ